MPPGTGHGISGINPLPVSMAFSSDGSSLFNPWSVLGYSSQGQDSSSVSEGTVVLGSSARPTAVWFYDFGQVIRLLQVSVSLSLRGQITIPVG